MLYRENGIGIEATIETLYGNEELNEYEREVTENHCEGLLECVEGESFQLHMRYHGAQHARGDMDVRAWVDGREICGGHWRSNRRELILTSMRVKQGGEIFQGNLSFAPLMKTDDEDLVDVRGSGLRHLGTIKIEVQQGVIDYEYRNPHRRVGAREPRGQAATVGYVRETDHKLGCAVEATNLRPMNIDGGRGRDGRWKFFPDRHHPVVCTFTFRYHTRTKLMILGVIEDPAAVKSSDSNASRSESPGVRTPPNTAVTQDVSVAVKRELLLDGGEDDGEEIEVVKRVKIEDTGLGSAYQPIEVLDIADRRQSARFVLPPTGVIDLTDDRDNTPPRSTAFQELWRDIIVLGFSDFGS